jgi:hypothetical protein
MGPAYANLSAQCLVTLMAIVVGRRVRPLPFPLGETAKVLAATALMAAVVRAMPHRDDVIGLALPIGVGAIVYGATVVALDVIGLRNAALRFLVRLVRRRQPT